MTQPVHQLDSRGRWLILATAFSGWMFAGMEMALMPLATGSVVRDFAWGLKLDEAAMKLRISEWFNYYNASFLLGAAAGGAIFGALADRKGRTLAMGLSIVWYSLFTAISYWARNEGQMLALRFVAFLGVGGMWPAGVALASEAWSGAKRPTIAGLMGAAANVGILLVSLITQRHPLTADSWRWVMLLGGAPIALGLFVLKFVPESPQWTSRGKAAAAGAGKTAPGPWIFRGAMLRVTLVGIVLGAVPVFGAWGAQKWILPWAESGSDPALKSVTQMWWAIGAVLGSLSGGWIATLMGRRVSYFVISLLSLAISSYVFRSLSPSHDPHFLGPVFLLGLVATVYFGWLPLFLPELFPTAVRATGSGVCYNFGRIASAAGVLGATALVNAFNGDYARIGAAASFIYALGMIVIWFAPSGSGGNLED